LFGNQVGGAIALEHQARMSAPFRAIGVFLVFGATMAALAALTLLWTGTPFDRAWTLNPIAYSQLSTRPRLFGTMFVLLSFMLTCAAVGWFRLRRWGWGLAVTIISIQVAGDFGNLIRGDLLRGITGFLVAGGLLVYLLRPRVRRAFQ